VREAQAIRLMPRYRGWATNSLEKARQAARLDPTSDAHIQAAAAFLGLDAWAYEHQPGMVGTAVHFDAPGQRVAVTGGLNWRHTNSPSQVLDVRGKQLDLLAPDQRGLLTFAPDGRLELWSWSVTNGLSLQDPTLSRVLRTFEAPGTAPPPYPDRPLLLRSPDGAWVVAAGDDTNGPSPVLWRTVDGRRVAALEKPVSALAFSPDSTVLAAGHEDGRVTLHALPSLVAIATIHPDRVPVLGLALTRDPLVRLSDEPANPSWLVAIGTAGGMIYLCDSAAGAVRNSCRGSHYDVYALAFHPDGMTLLSCGRDEARFWDVATGQLLLREPDVEDFQVSLAIAPNGTNAVVGTQYPWNRIPGVYLIRVEPDRGIRTLRGLTTQIAQTEFSPDGHRLAALAHNWQLAIWSAQSNRLEQVLQMPRGQTADNTAFRFSLDGRQLAFATHGAALLWDLEGRTALQRWSTPAGGMPSLAYDAEGRLLLFQRERPSSGGGAIGVIRQLRPDAQSVSLAAFPEFDQALDHAAFTADGRHFLICGRGKLDPTNQHTLKIVAPDTGRVLFATNPDLVLSPDHQSHFPPAFSPDGHLMAWGTDDGLVFVADPDDLLRRLADMGL
jgi:WD40 repeat protein